MDANYFSQGGSLVRFSLVLNDLAFRRIGTDGFSGLEALVFARDLDFEAVVATFHTYIRCTVGKRWGKKKIF